MAPALQRAVGAGRAFGTIGGTLRENGVKVEVTTFRSEAYVDHSRKPAVEWGDSLEADLSRRDFTINALALDVIALNDGRAGVQTFFDYYRRLPGPPRPRAAHPDRSRGPLPRRSVANAARRALRRALRHDASTRSIEAAATEMAERLTRSRPSASAASSTCCW